MYLGFVVLLIVSLAPIVFLIWYFNRLDRTNPESRRFLWSIFMWGVMVTFVAGVIEWFLDKYFLGIFFLPFIQLIVSAFIFTAVVEEALKYWVVKRKAYPHPAFNEHFDGIIYAVVASLGFAALENLFYVFEHGIFIGIVRAMTAVPAHALFGCMMGYYMGLAKFAKTKVQEEKLLRKGLILAIFFHGLYDFLLFTNPIFLFVVLPLLLAMAINVKYKIAHLHVLDKIKGAVMPPTWRALDYVKTFFGMIFFTIGVMGVFAIALYLTSDPIGADIFKETEFYLAETSFFVAISWGISYLLIRRKKRKK